MNYLRAILGFGLSAGVDVLRVLVQGYFDDQRRRYPDRHWLHPAQHGVGFLLALVSTLGWLYGMAFIILGEKPTGPLAFREKVWGIASVVAIGWYLFNIRKHYRRIYATTELSAAVVTAWTSLSGRSGWDSPTSWLALTGAVYLLVRGFDNLTQGNKEAREAEELKSKARAPSSAT